MPPRTQVDQQLAQAEKKHNPDPQRAELIARTRRFKSSWHELAEVLVACQKGQLYTKWGYSSFEEYFRKELRLKTATVNKLVGNFTYLQKVAPEVLNRDGVAESIPSAESVDFLRKSAELCADGHVPAELHDQVRAAVIDDGLSAGLLARKFKPVLFPDDQAAEVVKKRRDAARTANQLAARLESLRTSLPEGVFSQASSALDQLLAVLLASDSGEPPPAAPACTTAPAPTRPVIRDAPTPAGPAGAAEEEDGPEAGGDNLPPTAAEKRAHDRVHMAHQRAVVYLCSLEQSQDEAALQRMRKGLLWHLKILSDKNLVNLSTLFPVRQWKLILDVAAADPEARRHLDRALGPQAWPGIGTGPLQSSRRQDAHSSAAA